MSRCVRIRSDKGSKNNPGKHTFSDLCLAPQMAGGFNVVLRMHIFLSDCLVLLQAQIELELVHLWRQVGALQEKVSSGQNLLVSELFAIKPPESLR